MSRDDVNLGLACNGLILNLDDGPAVIGFYDTGARELHLATVASPVHVCSARQALRVAGVYAFHGYEHNDAETPSGVTFH